MACIASFYDFTTLRARCLRMCIHAVSHTIRLQKCTLIHATFDAIHKNNCLRGVADSAILPPRAHHHHHLLLGNPPPSGLWVYRLRLRLFLRLYDFTCEMLAYVYTRRLAYDPFAEMHSYTLRYSSASSTSSSSFAPRKSATVWALGLPPPATTRCARGGRIAESATPRKQLFLRLYDFTCEMLAYVTIESQGRNRGLFMACIASNVACIRVHFCKRIVCETACIHIRKHLARKVVKS
jgi:hypothetical protein